MRASDADRDRAAGALREHHAAGRISDEELEERLSVALTASTLDELAAPFADLTPPPLSPARPAEPITIGGYGLREFRQRHVLACDRASAWRSVMAHIAPSMSAYGYTVVDRYEPDYIVFELEERPTWPWLFMGMAALFVSDRPTRVVVALSEPTPGHTELLVSGTARRPVRRAFAGLSSPS